MHVGVLSFQGDFAEHLEIFRSLGANCCEVRAVKDLHDCTHLIIPGGESTVMSKFLASSELDCEIIRRVGEETLSIYGTCAGAILLAKDVTGKNAPKSLELLDITIERNAYGEQTESFETELQIRGIGTLVQASFIRAPKISKVGNEVEVLCNHDGKPVLVRTRRILAGTFHTEVRGELRLHEFFLSL